MSYRPLEPAVPAAAGDGTPYSERYADLYHSAQGGLPQARQVFLAGNGLPQAWAGRERFVILETGFGLGLNFLVAWQAWQADPQRCRQLHFVSVEKHPFGREDLAALLARWPEFAAQARELLAAWPPLLPGLHRLHLAGGMLHLTLVFGDAADWLPQLCLAADALFLDGFAPDRNEAMWSAETLAAATRLAAPGATLATWSVAVPIRERLAPCGWQLERREGFGNKKYMLAGRLPGRRRELAPADRRVAVVGAGLAGSSVAQRLVARGFSVTVLDAAAAVAQGASGNRAGVFRPLPSRDDNRLARLLRASFLYGRRHLEGLPGVRRALCGVLHLARDARHEDSQRCIVETQQPPAEFLRYLDREAAMALAGWPVAAGGWWFPGGGWVDPPSLCQANLAGSEVRCASPVARLEREAAGWRLLAADGRTLAEAASVVLANGVGIRALAALPVRSGRGVVSHIPAGSLPPLAAVATRNGYVTPAIDGWHYAGATLATADTAAQPRRDDHLENLLRLEAILPGATAALDPDRLAGRVGFRPLSPDRLPIVGPLSASDGLWVANGFGARGLVWAALAGELLAAQLTGEPLPIERELAEAVAPSRFGDRPPKKNGV